MFSIYSLHKFETFEYLKKFYAKNDVKTVNGFKIQYDLPKTYKFHKKSKTVLIYLDNKIIEVLCMEAFIN
jgi:predicted RNA methylase